MCVVLCMVLIIESLSVHMIVTVFSLPIAFKKKKKKSRYLFFLLHTICLLQPRVKAYH